VKLSCGCDKIKIRIYKALFFDIIIIKVFKAKIPDFKE